MKIVVRLLVVSQFACSAKRKAEHENVDGRDSTGGAQKKLPAASILAPDIPGRFFPLG